MESVGRPVVVRPRDQHQGLTFQRHDVEIGRRGGLGGPEDADLGGAGSDQRQHLLGSEGGFGVNGHVGMGPRERGEDGGERFHAGRGHGDEVDPAAAQSFECSHGGFGLVEIAQHHSGRADQCGAGLTQDDAAADAVKQRHPEFTFEGGDRLRQRGLGDQQMLGGAAEAVVIDHGKEEFQLPDVHRRRPPACIDRSSLYAGSNFGLRRINRCDR